MIGLVILGLLTVVAGVLTGRTTLQHVLQTDARDATISWTKVVDTSLSKSGKLDNEVLGLQTRVLAPDALAQHANSVASADVYDLHKTDPRGGGLENLMLDWIGNNGASNPDDYVSRLDGFAILSPNRKLLATGGNFDGKSFAEALKDPAAQAGLDQAIETGHLQFSDGFDSGPAEPLAFVPVRSQDGSLDRVYAFRIDQRAAADMTDTALTVVSFATSLLIVMGFSVPAAIASRRIRERWKAEDQIRFLALHDSLTGLPNRLQLRQTLDRAVSRCARHGTYMAVLCLDLDRFKDINDTLGHPTGDLLLQEVSARCAPMSVRSISWGASAATSSPSLPNSSRRRRTSSPWRGGSPPP
nr:GGDEF domain-containing protein [Methyloligella halotolerans]